jgi:hypothetical protein
MSTDQVINVVDTTTASIDNCLYSSLLIFKSLRMVIRRGSKCVTNPGKDPLNDIEAGKYKISILG